MPYTICILLNVEIPTSKGVDKLSDGVTIHHVNRLGYEPHQKESCYYIQYIEYESGLQVEKERKMNISEGSFYEARDGEGYVYISERDGDLISYVACSEPTKKALTAADAYIGEVSKQDLEAKIVYPFCQCKGYTAWADVPMDIHEDCDISYRISKLEEHNYYNKKDVEELCNIIKGILDRGNADDEDDEECCFA